MDVWTSQNGIDWQINTELGYSLRNSTEFVSFKNNLWIIGGGRLVAESFNDVWSLK
jgi:hypothetical protein